jgi:hypothetical protein
LFLQSIQLRLCPLKLLAEFQHLPFLRCNGGQKARAIILIIEHDRSSSGRERRWTGCRECGRCHRFGGSDAWIGFKIRNNVDRKVEG